MGDADYEGPDRTVTIFDLLDQDKVWWPKNADEPIRLKDMTIEHRYNLVGWLERHAEKLKRAQEIPSRQIVAHYSPNGASNWEMGYQPRLEPVFTFSDQPADEWLGAKPLMVKLRKQLAEHERELRREWILKQITDGNLPHSIFPTMHRTWSKNNATLIRWIASANGQSVELVEEYRDHDKIPQLFVYAVLRELSGGDVLTGVELIDKKGHVHASVVGVRYDPRMGSYRRRMI